MNIIRGVDVSIYQPRVDWRQLAVDGFKFAFARATDGLVPDKMHDVHAANARAAGLPIGSYHYGHPSQDVKEAAEFFVARATLRELRPVLDMETLSNSRVPPNAPQWSDDFCEWVKYLSGCEPIIYASKSYWETMCALLPKLGGSSGWDWWNAEYVDNTPCRPVTRLPYVAHQYAGNVKVPGQVGLWDLDAVYADTIDALRV